MCSFEGVRLVGDVELRKRVEELEAENRKLRVEIECLLTHPTILRGIRGETLICEALDCQRTDHNAGHDIHLKRRGLRIEVKFARLNDPNRAAATSTRRWAWANVFGTGGRKEYDVLILIPYAEVLALTVRTGENKRSIQLTSNPATNTGSSAAPLWTRYQTTLSQLAARYREDSSESV
jgi:hypothetical protein